MEEKCVESVWIAVLQAIDNARAQNEHLVVREMNLELMDELAAQGLLDRNRAMERILQAEDEQLRKAKHHILQVSHQQKCSIGRFE